LAEIQAHPAAELAGQNCRSTLRCLRACE
jgi:hypothetical protein